MEATEGVILALDQGTTGSTALVLNHELEVVARANTEFPQIYPKPGWVEHDPEAIWRSIRTSVMEALDDARVGAERIRAIGITNQRETCLFWDRATGEPIHNAIVWQCRRTTDACRLLKEEGHEPMLREKTGLIIDPYFSATKAAWLLDHVEGARGRAAVGDLAFGTMDSYVLWRLTGGEVHATDVSNASRTQLLNIHEVRWDDRLLELFDVPAECLPEVRSSSEIYGETRGLSFLPDGIPVAGIAGDQQAALFGQACFEPGEAKATYGTGAFVLMNTGSEAPLSDNGLLTTIGWRLGDGPTTYALEGAVFIAGAAVQWLRDGLQIIGSAPESEALARSVPDSGGVVMVPAFAGLGAPYWDPEARGAILGLTRGTGRGHIARATLESIAQQVTDVVEAMIADSGRSLHGMKVDGGAAANRLLMETQAELLHSPVSRSAILETTALGAGLLAGIATGFWEGPHEIQARWKEDARFAPTIHVDERDARRSAWKEAVARVRSSGA
ncbi:MAG: glycerol kinase GlpK [Myxococcota bacterium]